MAENNNIAVAENIQNLIYSVRGKQVMLDSDLAKLYQVTIGNLNKAVKRNLSRNYGGRRYMPYVFTEQGIAMLSAVLKSDIAVDVSIKIMDAFVQMRNFLRSNKKMFARLDRVELKNTLNILCKKNKGADIVIATAGKGNLSTKDINTFNAQYPTLSVKTTTDFHDRFLIIDKTEVYHIGASMKDAGKKSFGITEIEDKDLIQSLINKVR